MRSLMAISSPAPSASTWRPPVGSRPSIAYLGRVPKARILEAVREAKGEHSAQLIGHLKKTEMAKEAGRLLEGSGWLPERLRLAGAEPEVGEPAREARALPDFLTGEEDATADPDDDGPRAIAAE